MPIRAGHHKPTAEKILDHSQSKVVVILEVRSSSKVYADVAGFDFHVLPKILRRFAKELEDRGFGPQRAKSKGEKV